jgi:hypothetical protein
MVIVIKADCNLGEEGTTMTEITEQELNEMVPLINEIRNNSGYFPTGSKMHYEDPSIQDIYGKFPGIENFISRIPCPISGIERISEIHVFSEAPSSLYM